MADFDRIKRNVGRMVSGGAPEHEIDSYLQGEGVTPEQLRAYGNGPGVGLDVLKSIPSGLAQGAIGAVAFPGDIANAAIDAFRPAQPIQPANTDPSFQGITGAQGKDVSLPPSPSGIPGSEQMRRYVEENLTGPLYQAQTPLGRITQNMASFAPNAISPGSLGRRLIAGVAVPAIASELAGQAAKDTPFEGAARAGGALLGGFGGSGAIGAIDNARISAPGMSRGAGRILEKTMGPGAEGKLSSLGPDAFLFEGTPDMTGVAQTVATRPGSGRGQIVNAVTDRQLGANGRLAADLNGAVGPAEVPSVVEAALKQQRDIAAKDYPAALAYAQRVDTAPILKRMDREISVEAGAPKKTLQEIQSYLIKGRDKDGNVIPKTDAESILNARQAVDDLISRTTEPNALGLAKKYRGVIDDALGTAAPSVKTVDAKFSELAKQSEAMGRGQTVLNTGKEAIRPIELAQDMATMSPGEKSLLRVGTRADLDRMVGTKANDVTALKLAVQSEGDWNRTKLAYVFGQDAADKIMRSVDREAAFQDAYQKITQNSQTAQRLAGSKLVEDSTTRAPVKGDLTVMGAVATLGQGAYRQVVDAIKGSNRGIADDELAKILTTQGGARDAIVQAIRDTEARRSPLRTSRRDELLRALGAIEAGTIPVRGQDAGAGR